MGSKDTSDELDNCSFTIMATGGGDPGEAERHRSECPVCLEVYVNPKVLKMATGGGDPGEAERHLSECPMCQTCL